MPAEKDAVVEWPQERRLRLNKQNFSLQRFSDIPEGLLLKVKKTKAFSNLRQTLILACNEKTEQQETISTALEFINRSKTLKNYDDAFQQGVLALACAEAVKMIPTHEMWEYLWSLSWHSRPLATFFPQSVIDTAKSNAQFRNQFLKIAHSLVEEAAHNPGRRSPERFKTMGKNLRAHWKKDPQLSTLWKGNFQNSFDMVGQDDDHVLSIVSEINMSEFVGLLTLYDYPDPVYHALRWSGKAHRFVCWKDLALFSPRAFSESGEWNGSMILPLLLTMAREQFRFNLGLKPSPEQISEATNEIKALSSEIAKIIKDREDSRECLLRWGNWLVRTTISAVSANLFPYPKDAGSQGFIEDSLLEALITEIPESGWRSKHSPDVEPWEPWCQLILEALISLKKSESMPPLKKFWEEWALTPDEWSEKKGETLQNHASPFETYPQRADGYGARLLALPMVEFNSADLVWKNFWDVTSTLREIVEFGDADEINEGGWEGREKAARLLILQFSIGLMLMDHLIQPQRPLDYDRQKALEHLLPLLWDSVREMIAIDQLNRKFWLETLRHLAIRRAKWFSSSSELDISFNQESKPTLADFIQSLAGDTENLLLLVLTAQGNGINKKDIIEAFKTAEIDISTEISIAESLLSLSPRVISLNIDQIEALKELIS